MKKNHIVILVIAIALSVSGFFLYQWWQDNRNTTAWTLVPQGAVVALETSDVQETWESLNKLSVWESLSTIPGISEIEAKVDAIDSVTGGKDGLSGFLNGRQVVVSLHPVSNTSFGFIFYLPVNSSKDREFLNTIVSGFENDKNYRKTQRSFQGISINVIKHKKDPDNIFSYILHNNWLVGSYNSLLIEDVIRAVDNGNNFSGNNKEAFDLSKAGETSAKVYVDYTYFHRFLILFAQQNSYGLLQPIQNFATSSSFDVDLSHQDILLNGFTTSNNSKNFINCFKDQKAQAFDVKRLVPNRTAVFYHYGFDKPVQLKESFKNFWSSNGLPINQHWEKINSKYKIDLNECYTWMKNEVGLSILESMNPQNPDRLIFISTKEPSKAEASLDQMIKKVSKTLKDTVYRENFGEYKIKQINISHFPAILLGQMFSGFDQCFYTVINNYVVFSNTIQGLKSLITDVEREDTWGRSIKQNLFLEQCQKESNVSIFINGPRYYNIFLAHSSVKWKPFFSKFSTQLKRFENNAVQFSSVDNKFYTSVIFKHINLKKENKKKEVFELTKNSVLEFPAIIRPFVVKNHYDKSNEIFVQDSLKQIYLISKEGQILWKKPISAKIVGDVIQVDYFKNGKLQLCFATRDKLHILDRNGVEVGKFPVDLPNRAEAYNLAVIDYDNSKDYRFVVSDVNGNIYMFDKSGKNLEGWNPKEGAYRLAAPVKHVRVKNRDYLIVLQQNGFVQLYTRKGEVYKGFPLNLNAPVRKQLFMDQGPTVESTKFTTITESGKIVQFNLAGEILKQEQWVKPGKDSKFELVSDVFARNWIIARQDEDKITILDAEGNTIFEQETPTNSRLNVQFYNFGGGNEIYAVTDYEQEFTYLYDKEGKLVNATPIESGFEVALTYSEAAERYKAYKVFSEEASVVSFK